MEQVDLQSVLRRMELACVDDEAVSEREATMRRLEAENARIQRRDRLSRESIALRPDIHQAIVDGAQMRPTVALQAVQKWMGSSNVAPVLVLAGSTGIGKSVAAAWSIANSHHGGHWRSAARVCRTFAGQFGDALEEQELLCECYLLVLDDLGAEHDHARMAGALVELLDQRKRHASRTRTIITTNLNKAAFKETYPDERLFSRMREASQWVSDGASEDMRRGGKG